MLTPIEIQGITFKTGRGYKKDDVDSFMKALHHDYEIMYKENKELKDKVATLSDGIQYYKNLEKTLQKALVLAEKTSDETKEAARKQAETIEQQAKLNAEQIIYEAKQEYEKTEAKTKELLQKFEIYKAQFKQIATTQLELLDSGCFDIRQNDAKKFTLSEEKVNLDIEKTLDVDKVEVQATDEEKLQAVKLAKEVIEEQYAESASAKQVADLSQEEEDVSDEVKKEDEFRVNLDGISLEEEAVAEELELDKQEESAEETLADEVKESNDLIEDEKKTDQETDLEIKMLQKLLNEIKKNNDPETRDEEFEFINTESDD